MIGLTTAGGRLVAVGRIDDGAGGTVAAAWRSDDGQTWAAVAVDGAASARMNDVLARPGGALLAVGQSTASDGDGDGAAWTSTDGTSWQRATLTGADGLGTQTLDRVVTLAGGGLLTVGQEPEGAGTVARFRTSPDGAGWTDADAALPADTEVTGLARLADGRLVATGSISAGGRRPARLWLADAAGKRWEPEDAVLTSGSADGITITGLTVPDPAAGGTAQAVGSASGPLPATWTVTVDQPR
jgi:hypothetical protein